MYQVLVISPSFKITDHSINFNTEKIFIMTNQISYSRECSIYPGEYIPLAAIVDLMNELKSPRKNAEGKPALNIDEYEDHYKIEVSIPGVSREDIFIHVHNNILSLMVLQRSFEPGVKKLKIHEYNTDRLVRRIRLPRNADTEFVCAEYRQGVLSLHIPKTNHPQKTITNQVVVY